MTALVSTIIAGVLSFIAIAGLALFFGWAR